MFNEDFYLPLYLPLCLDRTRDTVCNKHGWVMTRVIIFREKNYSAEHGTDGNFDSFCQDSVCIAELKEVLRREIQGLKV